MAKDLGKTVYFFGAGSSAASTYNLPVMGAFFLEEDFKGDSYPFLHRFISNKFPGVETGRLNLEEVVTTMELNLDKFASFGEPAEAEVQKARSELDQYVAERLAIANRQGCKQIGKLINAELAAIESRDSVITLNYDLVVDNTLWERSLKGPSKELRPECLLDRTYNILQRTQLFHGERPSMYHKSKGLGFYLKLHGSIDWLYCVNTSCGNHQIFFANWIGSEPIHNDPGDLCSLCGMPLVNVIVPPTMAKTFEKYPKLGFLWSLAYRELRTAERIVIFGISFAPSDYYLSWLLKKAILDRKERPKIFNIDINKMPRERIRELTGIDPVVVESIDEYLGCK